MLHRPSVIHDEKPTFPINKVGKFFEARSPEGRFLAVLFITGIRQGDLMRLRWEDAVDRGELVEGLKQTRKTGRRRQHQIGISPRTTAYGKPDV